MYKPPFLKVRDIIRKGIDFDLKDESFPSPYVLELRIQLPPHSSMPLSSTALSDLPSTPLLGIHWIFLFSDLITLPVLDCHGFDYCYSFSVSELSDFLLRNYSKSFSCYDTFHRPVWLSYSTFQTGPWYSIQTTFLNSIVITSELILYVSNSFEMLH